MRPAPIPWPPPTATEEPKRADLLISRDMDPGASDKNSIEGPSVYNSGHRGNPARWFLLFRATEG